MNFQLLFKRNRYDVSGRDAFNRHLEWCFGIAVIFAFVILIKTGVVQLNELCKMQSKITKQNMVWDSLSMPLRGEIRDRNGVLMATSLPIQTVVMDPFRILTSILHFRVLPRLGPHRTESILHLFRRFGKRRRGPHRRR